MVAAWKVEAMVTEETVAERKVHLTPADIANGWTEETVAEHVAQAEAYEHAQLMERLFPAKPRIRVEGCGRGFDAHEWGGGYDPFKWGGKFDPHQW